MAVGKEIATQSRVTELESLVASVQRRIDDLAGKDEINFPANYSVGNALRSAWLAIQETKNINGGRAIDVCTKESICNALFNTVVQGLSPAKKQVYYIVYGDQLQASRSYFGSMAVVKRLPSVKDVFADVVYENDVFKISKRHGTWVIDEHASSFENIDPENIVAAYCTIEKADGELYTEVMNMKQIQQSWNRSKSKQTVHKEFPDQMAKKTVISRACKYFVNSSDDSDVLIEAFNSTGDELKTDFESAKPKTDDRLEQLNSELKAAKQKEKESAIEVAEDQIKTPPVLSGEQQTTEADSPKPLNEIMQKMSVTRGCGNLKKEKTSEADAAPEVSDKEGKEAQVGEQIRIDG